MVRPSSRLIPILALAVLAVVAGSTARHEAAQERDTTPLSPPWQQAALQDTDRAVLAHCLRNVHMIHDVHWAAACSLQPDDDSPDCMLPEAEAARLNARLDRAEAMCHAFAQASR